MQWTNCEASWKQEVAANCSHLMRVQVPRLVPGRLLWLELERVAANTSRLMGRRVLPPPVDAAQLHGGEAHVAALLSWVQVSSGCSPCAAQEKAC